MVNYLFDLANILLVLAIAETIFIIYLLIKTFYTYGEYRNLKNECADHRLRVKKQIESINKYGSNQKHDRLFDKK